MNTTLLMANHFANYEQAQHVYEQCVIPKYGALRLPWAFPKWLMLPASAVDLPKLEYWQLLYKHSLLTSDGIKRLKKAMKKAESDKGNRKPGE